MLSYRADIDGLRALAVIVVILYHFGIPGFEGGYIGVDVFFVISGFLIGSTILFQLENRKFKFSTFYFRRIRRLLPVYILVIIATFIGAYIIMLPADFKEYGQSIIAASGYISNFLFYREAGYFDTVSHIKPLLHTLFLSVEEQFYLIFPFLAWLFYKASKRRMIALVAALTLLSLISALVVVNLDLKAAFFLYPFRAWEMFLGVLLASNTKKNSLRQSTANIFSLLGVLLIIFPSIFYNSEIKFPGVYAVVPCIGTVLYIYSGSGKTTKIHNWFSKSVPVGVGKISYSLYLWHWPVYVLYAYTHIHSEYNKLSLFEGSFLIVSIFTLSFLSWKFVESPFRQGKFKIAQSKPLVFLATALFSTLFISTGFYIHRSNGVPDRLSSEEQLFAAAANDVFGFHGDCQKENNPDFPGLKNCVIGTPKNSDSFILVWGDSHVAAFKEGLNKVFSENHRDALLVWSAGCPPVFGIKKDESVSSKIVDDKCYNQNNLLHDFIVRHSQQIESVVLIGRWSYYLNGEGYGIDASNRVSIWKAGSKRNNVTDQEKVFLSSFKATIDEISKYEASIYVVEQPPEFSDFNARRIAITYILDKRNYREIAESISKESAESVDIRQGDFQQLINQMETNDKIRVLRTHKYFCKNDECSAFVNEMPVFFDNNHISTYGAKQISKEFVQIISAKNKDT